MFLYSMTRARSAGASASTKARCSRSRSSQGARIEASVANSAPGIVASDPPVLAERRRDLEQAAVRPAVIVVEPADHLDAHHPP